MDLFSLILPQASNYSLFLPYTPISFLLPYVSKSHLTFPPFPSFCLFLPHFASCLHLLPHSVSFSLLVPHFPSLYLILHHLLPPTSFCLLICFLICLIFLPSPSFTSSCLIFSPHASSFFLLPYTFSLFSFPSSCFIFHYFASFRLLLLPDCTSPCLLLPLSASLSLILHHFTAYCLILPPHSSSFFFIPPNFFFSSYLILPPIASFSAFWINKIE